MVYKTLSELDERVISIIEQNGRTSYRDVANLLGISERQAAARVRRLIDDDLIRVIAVVDAFAVGFNIILSIGVQVTDRRPIEVADALASLPNIISIALMTGPYDIELIAVIDNHDAMRGFVRDDLAGITGISTLQVSLLLDVVKYETGAGPVTHRQSHLDFPQQPRINKIDRGIITQLWGNASETNENMAARLEVSESTVRKRSKWLQKNGFVHITAMRNFTLGSDVVFAFIGINLSSPDRYGIGEKLRRLRQVHMVAYVLGRYDIIAQVLVSDNMELSSLVNDVIASIAGVRAINCAQAIKIVRYDHRWRLAGSAQCD